MKRYRIIYFSFDTRATVLNICQSPEHKRPVIESIEREYGILDLEQKVDNLTDFGTFSPSILPFFTPSFIEIQRSFIIGGYYPALTGACCLGESVLNYLIQILKNDFPLNARNRKLVCKRNIINWDKMLGILRDWEVLSPDIIGYFEQLRDIRHQEAAHFNPNSHINTRQVALRAINLLQKIIREQFGFLGGQPWIIPGTKGSFYIRKEYESYPFVKRVYLPYCYLVGPLHKMHIDKTTRSPSVEDDFQYVDKEVTDEEFANMVNAPEEYRDVVITA